MAEMTTKTQIETWFDDGVARGATHMMVVCDTFDFEDFPVYVSSTEDFHEKYQAERDKRMQKIMEVYDLRADKGSQMKEVRAWHLQKPR